jgi:hypothetical protein
LTFTDRVDAARDCVTVDLVILVLGGAAPLKKLSDQPGLTTAGALTTRPRRI